jgi:hypothetical protein
VTPSHDAFGTPLSPESVEFFKTTPPSPRSLVLSFAGGAPAGDDSVVPQGRPPSMTPAGI